MLRLLSFYFKIISSLVVIGILTAVYLIYHYSQNLPDYSQLANYYPPSVTRIYSNDGKLIEEYALEHRVFVPIHSIPQSLIEAFIAAEDKNFFSHSGLDLTSIVRAALSNIANILQRRRMEGGSTITQQVVKNFFLTPERSIERKVKEAILSYMISNCYTKHRILELYLNQLYLGRSSYGVAAAASTYFNKSIDELNLSESAFLAGLPKAPSAFNPEKNYARAKERRDYVIHRMLEDGYISKEAAQEALKSEIILSTKRDPTTTISAGYYAETVREKVIQMVGKDSFYQGGLTIITALDQAQQKYAELALRKGIREYDLKHGMRGKISKISITNWQRDLSKIVKPQSLLEYELAVVLEVVVDHVKIGLTDGKTAIIPLSEMLWAKTNLKSAKSIVDIGDVVVVERLLENSNKAHSSPKFGLRQIPAVNGAILVMSINTGQVLAACGGYDYQFSKFNRVTQALRQPGSLSKSFVYLAALEKNVQPNQIFTDGPIEISQGSGMPVWRPKNYKGDFLGNITMRMGLEKSRNLVTVRVAQKIGLENVVEVIKRFGINSNPRKVYSMVLGSIETTLEKMTTAYGIIANSGHKLEPQYIELIMDRNGKVIYQRDRRDRNIYKVTDEDLKDATPPLMLVREDTPAITDEASAYQVTSMLSGVVERGTAGGAKKLGKIIAGKTGTTNQSMDTWFIGFTPNIIVGTYIGFDTPKTLGKSATGASVALPVFINFMEKAYTQKPSLEFIAPDSIKLLKIDYATGNVSKNDKGIVEAFKTYQPNHELNIQIVPVTPNNGDIFDKIETTDPSQEVY